ncbi:alpha/beta fold hydrolase [Bradyrhizobium sp. URHD0069]|uniref:alpha/beta fold hydrolase n=1 Tax=Bradyrhizobium sp. URHD0069 TaxID=1380355 RepID=UPI00068947E4|nr:alpha/beta fold hydrolase [Bradyrhizobium sp. URHD0069]
MIQNSMFPMFFMSDALRRWLGWLLDDSGFAPHEASWHVVLAQPDLRLRRYGEHAGTAGPVLIVPAPIKRPYIFDLLPEVSVIRRLTEAGFSVYLSEWCEEESGSSDLGNSVGSLRSALEKIASEHGRAPIVVGHSLGGTLAAILAAIEPLRVDKLVLIEAPLRFGEQTGALRPITAYPDSWLFGETIEPIPGSLLDLASVAAAPEEFAFGRWADAWASLPDVEAFAIHARVIRWSLDEFAPPAPLLQSVVDLLYRQDRFARNELRVLGRLARLDSLAEIPTAAIVDYTSRLVPPSSALDPLSSATVFAYVPEIGVGLQHVGPLVGRRAHREIWPRVIAWMRGTHRHA